MSVSSIAGPFVRLVVNFPLPARLWRSDSLHRASAFSVIQELSHAVNFAALKVLDFSATVVPEEEDCHFVYLQGPDLPGVLRAVPKLREYYVSPKLVLEKSD